MQYFYYSQLKNIRMKKHIRYSKKKVRRRRGKERIIDKKKYDRSRIGREKNKTKKKGGDIREKQKNKSCERH